VVGVESGHGGTSLYQEFILFLWDTDFHGFTRILKK
jgi:hypothetical protein